MPTIHEQRVRIHLETFAPSKISNPPIRIGYKPEDTLINALKDFGALSPQYSYAKDVAKAQIKGKLTEQKDLDQAFNGLVWLVENN